MNDRRRSIPLTALQTYLPVLSEPTAVTFRGRQVGVFTPANVPDDSASHGRGVGAYTPEPTVALELAKLATEVAEVRSEVEQLHDQVCPDATGAVRAPARWDAFLRRRLHWARLREQHATGNE